MGPVMTLQHSNNAMDHHQQQQQRQSSVSHAAEAEPRLRPKSTNTTGEVPTMTISRPATTHVLPSTRSQTNSHSRDASVESRGRTSKRHNEPSGHGAYLLTTMRPPDLVRNIQRSQSTDERGHEQQPPVFRSREASTSTLHSHHRDHTSTHTRPSRFKHPMNAYNVTDTSFETVIPHHSSMLQQKYNQSQTNSRGSSFGNGSSHVSQRQSVVVAMGGDIVPAFDDMKMDMDEREEDEEETSVESDMDKSEPPSATDAHFPVVHDKEEIKKSVEEAIQRQNFTTAKPVGRIQQRITALRDLKDHGDERSWRGNGFSNVEQKTLLDSLNYDLQSLKRYNYRPLIASLQRVSQLDLGSGSQSETETEQADPPASPFLKTYLTNLSEVRQPPSKSPRKPNSERLQQLLRKSSEVTKSMWVDPKARQSMATTTLSSMQTPLSGQGLDLRRLPTNGSTGSAKTRELDRIQQHFAGFKLGHSVDNAHITSDPSPRTSQAKIL